MNFVPWRARADRLRAIPLEWVLRTSGALPDRFDPRKWRTQDCVLSVTGPKFIDWKGGHGGGGAIDLVMHLRHCGFGQALDWLESRFPNFAAPPMAPTDSPLGLRLPSPCAQRLDAVREYLIRRRGLPAPLVDRLIHTEDCYADTRSNAVFLLRDAQGHPVGAELRGTSAAPWRGMAPGSRKDHGYFVAPSLAEASPTPLHAPILLSESAIDALSCSLLNPGSRCLSTAGARPNPGWLRGLVATGVEIRCAFDTDATGESMARAMMDLYPSIGRLPPACHDWNDALRAQRV